MPPKVSNKDPKKPKGRTSAYACYLKFKREECREEGKEVAFTEFSKDCADKWKSMKDAQKAKFHTLAEKDKERYEKAMKHYKPSPGYNNKGKLEGGKKRRGRKKDKDPNMPKRAMSGFFWFCQAKRPKMRENNPSGGIGEIAKELGAAWKAMSVEEKAPYEVSAKKDRARYETAIAEYRAKPLAVAEDDDEEEEEEEEEDGVSEDED